MGSVLCQVSTVDLDLIERLVAAAPPLTAEQRVTLTSAFADLTVGGEG